MTQATQVLSKTAKDTGDTLTLARYNGIQNPHLIYPGTT